MSPVSQAKFRNETSRDVFDAWYENEFNPNPTGNQRAGFDYRGSLLMAFDAGRKSAGRICLEVGRRPAGRSGKALRMVRALMPAIHSLKSTTQAMCRGVDDLRGKKYCVVGKNDLAEAIRLLDETRDCLVLIARKLGIRENA